MAGSAKDRRQAGYNMLFLVLGLFLGIEGNFFVSFFMKAVDTNYSPEWVAYSLVFLVILIGVGFVLWRKAVDLIGAPKKR